MDIIATEIATSQPGSVFQDNGVDKTFVRQPAICIKYLLDEQDKQFNWERLGQLGQNPLWRANTRVLRAPVNTNWLQHHNLREVQYMAGHKYVSSTERYRTDNLEGLQKDLEKHHPLKQGPHKQSGAGQM